MFPEGILGSTPCLDFKIDVDDLEEKRPPEVMAHRTCSQVCVAGRGWGSLEAAGRGRKAAPANV